MIILLHETLICLPLTVPHGLEQNRISHLRHVLHKYIWTFPPLSHSCCRLSSRWDQLTQICICLCVVIYFTVIRCSVLNVVLKWHDHNRLHIKIVQYRAEEPVLFSNCVNIVQQTCISYRLSSLLSKPKCTLRRHEANKGFTEVNVK